MVNGLLVVGVEVGHPVAHVFLLLGLPGQHHIEGFFLTDPSIFEHLIIDLPSCDIRIYSFLLPV